MRINVNGREIATTESGFLENIESCTRNMRNRFII